MMYPNLQLPTLPDRPFFYANFVQSIDGKVQVTADPKAYWPLGSEEDFDTLLGLRAYADVLIHGKNTATAFRTLDRLGSNAFQERRKEITSKSILYVVVSGHPDASLVPFLENLPAGVTVLLVTTNEAEIIPELAKVPLLRCGGQTVMVRKLSEYLRSQGMQRVLLEGGPHLFASFVRENLLDELFLTITPKLIGSTGTDTLTLLEGFRFPPTEVPTCSLVSVLQHEQELYLRYRCS